MEKKDLVAGLDRHDALVLRCAAGDLPYDQFETEYNNFSQRWALDGRESAAETADPLGRYAERIRLQQRVWEEVLVHATV
jgi:MoxR-like ATPase